MVFHFWKSLLDLVGVQGYTRHIFIFLPPPPNNSFSLAMGVWAQPALPASEYFGALSYGAFLMSFGITVVGFAKASTDRPDWVYRLCAVVMCLMSCGVAYAAQYLHVETTSHGYTYDLLVWLHMVVSVSVAAAFAWPWYSANSATSRAAYGTSTARATSFCRSVDQRSRLQQHHQQL